MNSTACMDGRAGARILANVEDGSAEDERKLVVDPESVLSRPPKPFRRKRRLPRWLTKFHNVTEVLWLGVIVICGIAAIIGLRDVGAAYGVIWAGDR